VVDLAVERGGNVEGARAGEVAELDGIKIVGYTNVAGRVAASASGLYARNLFSFIETLIDKANKTLDRAEREKLFMEVNRQVQQDAPWLFLYAQQDTYGLRTRCSVIASRENSRRLSGFETRSARMSFNATRPPLRSAS